MPVCKCYCHFSAAVVSNFYWNQTICIVTLVLNGRGEHIECTSFGIVSYHLDFIVSQMKPQRRVGNVPNFRLLISFSLFTINIVSTRCHFIYPTILYIGCIVCCINACNFKCSVTFSYPWIDSLNELKVKPIKCFIYDKKKIGSFST